MFRMAKKRLAVFVAFIMLMTMIPSYEFGMENVQAANDKITLTKIAYGTTNTIDYGYVVAPDKPGNYPAIIMMHGYQGYVRVMDYLVPSLQDWIDKGLIEPMIFVVPLINNNKSDHEGFAKKTLPVLEERIRYGEFQTLINTKLQNVKIDTSEKTALCGWSMGGSVTAYAGMKYKDSFPYLGIFSPSAHALYPNLYDGDYYNYILKDPDTRDYQFTTRSDHLFMICSGLVESEYDDCANVHYTEFGKTAGFTKISWKTGNHTWNSDGHGFDWSAFYFLYTLQHGTEPTDQVMIQAFGESPAKTVIHPGDVVNKPAISGNLSFGGTEAKCGNTLSVSITDCNASGTARADKGHPSFAYHWYRDGQEIKYYRDKKYTLTTEDIGHRITVEVSNIVDKYSGKLTLTSDIVKSENGSITPQPTVKPTTAPTTKPTTAPTAKPVSISGTVTIKGTTKYSWPLQAEVSNCNATSLSYQWKRGETIISGATADRYTLTVDDIGFKMTCVVTDKSGKFVNSISGTSAVVTKADGPVAPSGLVAVNCTKGKKDGAIKNVTTAMEYSVVGDFSDRKDCTGTVISGLGEGFYVVRFKATATHFASGGTIVEIKANQPTPTPTTKPTTAPTIKPTTAPTTKPTTAPTTKPTTAPTTKPTTVPTTKPTTAPTAKPTEEVTSVFADVPAGKWFVNAIQFVYERGIMKGKGEDPNGSGKLIFDPNANLTRAEFATILYNMEGRPDVAFSHTILDVKNLSAWYAKPVHWVYEQNIAAGYPNGNFGVADPITREQLALMLYKYAKLKEYKTAYSDNSLDRFGDTNKISSWAVEAMKWATSNGVMNGSAHEVPLLNPKGNATRAECAAMIKSLFEKVIAK